LKRLTVIGMLTAGLLMLAAPAAVAGGWAITSMDELPGEFQAGEPYQLGYTILQHGKTPVDGAKTEITARNTTTGETLRFVGQADGKPGHYVAEVTFPEGGSWTWSVTQGDFAVHELGELTVSAAPAPSVAATATASLPIWGLVLAAATAIALGVFATQLVAVIRRRSAKPGLAD
jgi:hypothetical protein